MSRRRPGPCDYRRPHGRSARARPSGRAGTLLESILLADDRSLRVGAVHRLDHHEAIVLTHDRWKFDAGGIRSTPSCLLQRATSTATPHDDEVLLLRVAGTASLAMESDLFAVCEEALRTTLSKTYLKPTGMPVELVRIGSVSVLSDASARQGFEASRLRGDGQQSRLHREQDGSPRRDSHG